MNEDHEPPRHTGRYELPAPDAPDFASRAARLLLEAARVSEIDDAEKATGLRWADPRFVPEIRAIRADAIRTGDERLETVAARYLRAAGA